MFGKVYFPRMVVPISTVLSNLLRFSIQVVLFVAFWIYYFVTGSDISKRMLVEGLKGQYVMISGGNFYVKTPEFNSFYSLPDNLRWDGTIISLRIPYNNSQFNYIKYIE